MADLTEEERKAIASLKRVAQKWPESLWLFAGNGSLCVMKKGEDGERVMNDTECVDESYCVDTIDIENDGGDF